MTDRRQLPPHYRLALRDQPAIHPAQAPRGWEEDDPRPIIRRTQAAYVPAGRQTIDMPAVRLADPSVAIGAEIVPAATTEIRVVGSHSDRAEAWLRYSGPLTFGVAAVATIAAVALYDVPLLSWSALLTFGVVFVVAYSALLLRYWQTSPEGVTLTHTRNLWGHLRREQAHRHRIEREAWQDQRQIRSRNHDR